MKYPFNSFSLSNGRAALIETCIYMYVILVSEISAVNFIC